MPFDLEKYFTFSPYFANNENLSEKERDSLNEKADKLPDEIREHLIDVETSEVVEATISLFQLSEKQAVVLAVLIRRIFLKDSSKNQLNDDIIKYMNVDAQKSSDLVEYVEEKIFATTPTSVVEEVAEKGNVIDLKKQL